MAQAGRAYPYAMMNDLAYDFGPGEVAPRKFRLTTTATSSGTLTIPWRSLSIISTVAERRLDHDDIKWRFVHPTFSDQWIDLFWTLRFTGNMNPPSTPYGVWLKVEIWISGTKYGDQEPLQSAISFSTSPTSPVCQWTSWTHLLNPTLWQSMLTTKIFVGQWSEQPEYHPWRA